MSSNLPFDDFVKKQFSDYSPDVPDRIWENIIAKRRSKPKGFWVNWLSGGNLLILSLVLLVGGGFSYYLLSKNNTDKKIVADKDVSSQQKNIPPSQINNQTNNTGNTVLPDKKIDPSEKEVTNNSSSEKEKNISTSVNSDEIKSDDRSNTSVFNTSSSHINHNNKIKNADSYLKEGNVIKADREQVPFTIQNSITKNNASFNNDYANNKLIFPPLINNVGELTALKNLNSKSKLPDCPALEKNAAGNKKYWEVYAGPDHVSGNYKTYGDTASNNYLQKRKASTKLSSAFSAGVRYTKVFDNGMSVRSGLNYSQINEKFLYFNPNEIKLVTVITTRIIIRQPGDTVYIHDTLQYQQTGTRIKTTYNRYHTIDIPLVVGYELGNGKVHANINAGVIINVYAWYKGDLLDSLYQPVSITTGKGNSVYQFKNNIGVGFLGSVSVYYKITDRLHILVEPYFRYNLSPMSKENLNLQQKYNTAGLRAGVRFDLK